MNNNQRRHFRVEYPPSERPTLRVGGHDYKILDLSEGGLRFELGLRGSFIVNEAFRGVITFSDAVSCIVHGKILRVDQGQIIVTLTQGVPFARMLMEERNILQKYGRKLG